MMRYIRNRRFAMNCTQMRARVVYSAARQQAAAREHSKRDKAINIMLETVICLYVPAEGTQIEEGGGGGGGKEQLISTKIAIQRVPGTGTRQLSQ
jgi:hypothetical protein